MNLRCYIVKFNTKQSTLMYAQNLLIINSRIKNILWIYIKFLRHFVCLQLQSLENFVGYYNFILFVKLDFTINGNKSTGFIYMRKQGTSYKIYGIPCKICLESLNSNKRRQTFVLWPSTFIFLILIALFKFFQLN